MQRINRYGRFTQGEVNKIKKDRKLGLTYNELIKRYGISKWWCINHLRDIKPKTSWLEEKWHIAEKEAKKILISKGYSHIINLNDICPSPYWDYYAEKNNKKWLFDVTINSQKDLIEKGLRAVEGYKHAILLKKEDGWDMFQIYSKKI